VTQICLTLRGSPGALCMTSVDCSIQRRGRKLSPQSCNTHSWPPQPNLYPLPLPFRHPAIPGESATLCGFDFFLCLCAAGAARQKRFRSALSIACLRSTSHAPKSVINDSRYPRAQEACRCCARASRSASRMTVALTAKASAKQ